MADGDVPYTRGKAATGGAKYRARITAAQANGKNGTLRFTVGCSTLNPKGSIASHAGVSALVYLKRIE